MTDSKEKKKNSQDKLSSKKGTNLKKSKSDSNNKKTVLSKKATKNSQEELVPRLRIRVRAYEYRILDASVQQIMDTALRFDVEVRGPVPLPTEIKKYSVNRASFVYSKSKEQFEIRIHKRLIDIINPTQKVIESLTNMNLPSGVSIEVKTI